MGGLGYISSSKWFIMIDIAFKYILINFLWFLTVVLGLGILTIIPASISLFIVTKKFHNDHQLPIIRTFFKQFINNYQKGTIMLIMLMMLTLIFFYNIPFFINLYNQTNNPIYLLINYSSYLCITLISITFIQILVTATYFPNIKLKQMVKFAFIMAVGSPFKSLMSVFLIVFSIYFGMLYYTPIPLITGVLPTFLILMIFKNEYETLVESGV